VIKVKNDYNKSILTLFYKQISRRPEGKQD